MNVRPRAEAVQALSAADAGVTEADFVFARGGGKTFLLRQFAPYPFHVARPHRLDAARPDLATLYLQSASGGLYRGRQARPRRGNASGLSRTRDEPGRDRGASLDRRSHPDDDAPRRPSGITACPHDRSLCALSRYGAQCRDRMRDPARRARAARRGLRRPRSLWRGASLCGSRDRQPDSRGPTGGRWQRTARRSRARILTEAAARLAAGGRLAPSSSSAGQSTRPRWRGGLTRSACWAAPRPCPTTPAGASGCLPGRGEASRAAWSWRSQPASRRSPAVSPPGGESDRLSERRDYRRAMRK